MGHPTKTGNSEGGFTLVELMLAVIIVAVLLAVAFPSFMGSIRKSRRADGVAALNAVQLAQERWRANKPTYSDTLGSGGLNLSATSSSGYYAIAVATPVAPDNATQYTATATAVSGSSQANDGDCAVMGVKMNGGSVMYGSAASGTISNYAASGNPCWSR